jgi:signal transduction histidine kinase
VKEKPTYIELEKQFLKIEKEHKALKLSFTSQIEYAKTQKANFEDEKERTDEAEQIINFGTWQVDYEKDTTWWSPQTYKIFDLNPQETKINTDSWKLNILTEDRERVELILQESITNKIPFNIEYRIFTKGGILKYVKVKSIYYFDNNNNNNNILKSFGIVMDITLLKENELLAKKTSRNKTKLMSILEHDLRSPFNKILGFTGLLIDNVNDASFTETEKYLNIIHSSSQKTLHLLDNLLNWIRLHTTEIIFNPAVLSLSNVINTILELETLLAETKEITLSYDTIEDFEVYADNDMLKIVLRNLITNAIKFTDTGGEIRINSVLSKDGITIRISDTGIGMEPQKVKNLFTNNSYSNTLGTHNEKGRGKGLTICKEFIDRHHGKICVESEVSKGSTFKVILPNKKNSPITGTTYRLPVKNTLTIAPGPTLGFI